MPSAVEDGARHRNKAPQRSGEFLVQPLPSDWDSLWVENLRQFPGYPAPLAAWRIAARRELYNAALRFSREYRDVNPVAANADRLILSGHQPNLFHPGVWFKNFVLSHLGQRFSAVAIQLIIDNDLYRQATIRLPAGSIENPRVEHLPFDRPTQAVPYEIATPADQSLFQTFGDRVLHTLQPFIARPIIQHYWPRVLREQRRAANVGQSLAAARHAIEAENGLETLELPLSSICKTEAFQRFTVHMLANAKSFAEIHNRCLAEFRMQHKLRSPSHPVPDLSISPTEMETPFWVWSTSAPVRRRLYVRRSGHAIVLLDRNRFECRANNEEELAGRLGLLEAAGTAIRPRALMTTMYARLVLSDLFVHGIGGAVYDAVTDEIVRRFFLVEPPKFLTLTATVHLPIPCPAVTEGDLARLDAELREMVYHPEKYLAETDRTTRGLVSTKREWIGSTDSSANLHLRHQAIGDLNRRLFALLNARVAELQRRRLRMVDDLQQAKIFASREYSFVLFPNSLIAQLNALASSPK